MTRRWGDVGCLLGAPILKCLIFFYFVCLFVCLYVCMFVLFVLVVLMGRSLVRRWYLGPNDRHSHSARGGPDV